MQDGVNELKREPELIGKRKNRGFLQVKRKQNKQENKQGQQPVCNDIYGKYSVRCFAGTAHDTFNINLLMYEPALLEIHDISAIETVQIETPNRPASRTGCIQEKLACVKIFVVGLANVRRIV